MYGSGLVQVLPRLVNQKNPMNITKILQMREGGQSTRCHCFPHHGHYDVAQHCYHMALMCDELHPDPSRVLLSLILRHDLFERWTGDVPAIVKRWCPGLKNVLTTAEHRIEDTTGIESYRGGIPTAEDKRWLKALDETEFLMWCDDQIALGSDIARMKRQEVRASIDKLWSEIPKELQNFLGKYSWRRTPDDLS